MSAPRLTSVQWFVLGRLDDVHVRTDQRYAQSRAALIRKGLVVRDPATGRNVLTEAGRVEFAKLEAERAKLAKG